MGEIFGQIAKVPEVKQSNSNSRVRKTERLQSMDTPVDRILFLQRTVGNQAVSRLMKSGALQAKLRIGQPGDVYEPEADRVADAVMRMPEPGVQRQPIEDEEEEQIQTKPVTEQITPLVQRQVEEEEEELQMKVNPSVIQRQEPEEDEILQGKMSEVVQRQPEEEEEEPLQAKFASGLTGTLQAKTEAYQNNTDMPDHLKSGLENLSNMNLSNVRVHHNSSKPAQLDALAYTQGQDIHVGPGQEKHLPHEGWHAVQQMQGRVKPTMQAKRVSINDDADLEREADVMGEKALQAIPARSRKSPPAGAATPRRHGTGTTVQRAMKFEFQTKNKIWRNRGGKSERLDRKYGPNDFLVKGKSGVRLESETNGVLEFETGWKRKASALLAQVKEAFEMTQEINKPANKLPNGRHAFPFNVAHLRKGTKDELKSGRWERRKGKEGGREKILHSTESLEVEIVDPNWEAGIQSSESFLLSQYESFLKQHEWAFYKKSAIASVNKIMTTLNTAGTPASKLVNLRNLLLIIINYIERGRGGVASDLRGAFEDVKGMPSKQAFTLMSRTNFASMRNNLLSKEEQALFGKLATSKTLMKSFGLGPDSPVFVKGYGTKSHQPGPTIYKWLNGIHNGRDYLSVQRGKGISGAMGRFNIDKTKGHKHSGLVRFETRNRPSTSGGAFRNANEWVHYVSALFLVARFWRPRKTGKGETGLELK